MQLSLYVMQVYTLKLAAL